MSISRIKQIKRIIAHADVRDPRATLIAIEGVISQPKPKKPKAANPIMNFEMVGTPTGSTIEIKFNRKNLSPRHLVAAKQTLDEFAKDAFPECKGDCATCEYDEQETTDLGALFAKFEAELSKGTKQ